MGSVCVFGDYAIGDGASDLSDYQCVEIGSAG